METVTKKTKSIKNAEKRRERSKVAARCRRGKESEIFTDLSLSLPMPENLRAGLDKASVMRLTLCDLKMKNMMETVFPVNPELAGVLNEEFDSQINNAMGGFILVFSMDGDVIYASEGITTQLGICQYEIMGQSIFEFSHPCDHNDIRDLLTVKKGEDDLLQRSGLFRMKSTVTARGRNAHLRSGTFKVVNCIGRIFHGSEKDVSGKWFVSVCEPLLHPSDVDIPLNKQTFLSKHSPDMKFEYVDESISNFMGYKPEDLLGKSIFDFHHATDGDGFVKSFKSLYSKGQNQTERYRFLTKGGGWVWIVTQATVIYGNNSTTPNSVVCIHFITSGKEEKDVILSEVQMGEVVVVVPEVVVPTVPVVLPVAKPVLSESNSNVIPLEVRAPVRRPDLRCRYTMEENDFISDLLSGPLLNTATCSTAKIFAPRTEDMDSGFLMPVDDTLIESKEEPEDLTHLAPIAGDECVSLDIPLLEDLLATLDEADMEYSFIDPDSDEIPRYGLTGYSLQPYDETEKQAMFLPRTDTVLPMSPVMMRSDPTLMDTSMSKSPQLSPYQDMVSDSPLPGGFLSTSELGCSSSNQIDDELFSGRLEDNYIIPCTNNRLDIPEQNLNNLTTFIPTSSPPLKNIETVMRPQTTMPLVSSGVVWNGDESGPQTTMNKSCASDYEPPDDKKVFTAVPTTELRNSTWDRDKSKYLEGNDWTGEDDIRIQSSGPTPSKVTKIVPLSSANLIREMQENEDLDSGSGPPRIFILVPVTKRRASLNSNNSSSSGSDSDSNSCRRSSFGKIEENYDSKEFNAMLSTFGLEVHKSSGSINNADDFLKPQVDCGTKRLRKRNYAGSLLTDEPLSLLELTRHDCEVNAPTSELLQGNELITALEVGGSVDPSVVNNIV